MDGELIRLSGLSKFYTGSQSVVMGLNGLNISFSRGEFVAITGESGSGKSTLSQVISGILPYESGEMYFNGNPTSHFDSGDWERYRRDHISFISQNYGILPGVTVQENVISALLLTGMDRSEAQSAAHKLLVQVELWELRHRRAAKLSSGQKQRLSIARALAKPASILVADEPTGNLDPENSAKVIALLAQAARERLVILVTHEFDEAKDCATRHVVLQDGKVVMDAVLRDAAQPEAVQVRKAACGPMGVYVAGLQQRSRPIWSAFMAAFFALTAFAVFVFLGTFIVNQDDSHTRVYDNSVFRNGNPQRIIVVSADGSPMDEKDYAALSNVSYVERLETNGYVTDLQYGYREHTDYELVTYETSKKDMEGFPVITVHVYARILKNAPYIQTIPVLPEGETFLTGGREPENIFEVVACGDASLIGSTLTVHISHPDYWTADRTLPLEVTVVGVTDHGSDLYFHEDLGRLCVQVMQTAQDGYVFLPADDLDDNHFRGHQELATSLENQFIWSMESASRNKKIEIVKQKDEKIFGNVNYDPDSDAGAEESVTMHMPSVDMGGYFLYHLIGEKYLYFHEKENVWAFGKSDRPTADRFMVSFYPVDGTVTEDGSLTSGRYVIWSTTHEMAVSSKSEMLFSTIGFCYDAVPVHMENGVLTGYTDAEIWDVRVEQGQIVSIFHDGSILASKSSYQDRTNGFDIYWVAERVTELTGIHNMNIRRLVEVSPSRFDQLTWDGRAEQVSVFIADYGYTDRVLAEIQGMGYAALSPYQMGSLKQNPELAQEREQTLLICLIALAVVVALQMILLRAMFSTQMESYRLLSNIGLSARMARRSVLWQILSFALVGQIISVCALILCWNKGIERITGIIHYLPIGHMMLLVAVHLVVSVAAALWIQRALSRQVYAMTGRDSDLPMDEEEVA